MILLCKTDNSRIYNLRNWEDLEKLIVSLNRPTDVFPFLLRVLNVSSSYVFLRKIIIFAIT